MIEVITAILKKGDNVALVGFGTFEVRKRAAGNGRNPATGAALKFKASKALAFKAEVLKSGKKAVVRDLLQGAIAAIALS